MNGPTLDHGERYRARAYDIVVAVVDELGWDAFLELRSEARRESSSLHAQSHAFSQSVFFFFYRACSLACVRAPAVCVT